MSVSTQFLSGQAGHRHSSLLALTDKLEDKPQNVELIRLSVASQRALLEHAIVRPYKKNHYVFGKGDDNDKFFLVIKGQVELHMETIRCKALIARKGPDEFFGELSLLAGGPSLFSAVTIEDSLLGVLRRSAFEKCLSSSPLLLSAMMRHLAHTVNESTAKLSMLAMDAYGRLRFCLYRLAREIDGKLVIEGHWTQQQLADLIGCTRETIVKLITALKRGRWILCSRHQIILLKPLPENF